MRALEKEPGQRFQSADAFIAAIDAALKDPGGGADNGRILPLSPVVAVPEEPVAEGIDPEDEVDATPPPPNLPSVVAIVVLIGLLAGFALTRDTTTDVPSVTGNQLNVAIALLQQNGFSVGDARVEREVPPTKCRAGPGRRTLADEAREDCGFLTLLLLEAEGDADGRAPGPAAPRCPLPPA